MKRNVGIFASILAFVLWCSVGFAGEMAVSHATTWESPDQIEENSEDVSKIGDTPIPVGEHNRFHLSYPRLNVTLDPFALFFPSFGSSIAYAPLRHLAVKMGFSSWSWDRDRWSALHLTAPIYFRKMYSGFFLEPGLFGGYYQDLENENWKGGPQMLVGWHWFWDSGLNVSSAFGIGRDLVHVNDVNHYDNDDRYMGTGYFHVGYAF